MIMQIDYVDWVKIEEPELHCDSWPIFKILGNIILLPKPKTLMEAEQLQAKVSPSSA